MSTIDEAIRPHAWEYPDTFCECTVFIDGWEGYVKHLAAAVKEALAPAVRVLSDIKEDETVPMHHRADADQVLVEILETP